VPWPEDREEEQRLDRTQLTSYDSLIQRLRKAVGRADLGASTNWPLHKRASYCLKVVGAGGLVSMDNPISMRRAITILENYNPRAGE